MLRRFVKRDVFHDLTQLQLVRLDVGDEKNWVEGGDVITQQCGDLLAVKARDEAFLVYKPKTRLNVFLQGVISQRYPKLLWGVLKVPLSKEMLASNVSARSRYQLHVEDKSKKKQSLMYRNKEEKQKRE
ncbi:unnamed protein product [Merluccius merluccius]